MKDIVILAVETSCDETSIAVVKNKREVLSLVTNTQIETFEKVGGVIPELSSRMHVDNIFYVYKQALNEADVTIFDIDAIAITSGPGLVGSLLVGVNFVKTLSLIYDIKVIEVNHLIGHINAININNIITYPHLSLIVSGGHTELIYMNKEFEYIKVGKTLDDAAGECFDKVARILNLGYPGGPKIDKYAQFGNDKYDLPYPKNDKTLDFSFSGLKSACYNLSNQLKMKGIEIDKADFACSFQIRVIETLINKVKIAQQQYQVNSVSVVGGVSSNSFLRKRMEKEFSNIIIPNSIYSTDNAAMIGVAAFEQYERNNFIDVQRLNAIPNAEIKEENEE